MDEEMHVVNLTVKQKVTCLLYLESEKSFFRRRHSSPIPSKDTGPTIGVLESAPAVLPVCTGEPQYQ